MRLTTHREVHNMSGLNSVVAVYKTQADAEDGLHRLERAEYDLKTVSVAGREHEFGGHVTGYYHLAGSMKYWGARGLFWNNLWKSLPCAGYFKVPEFGGILLAGQLTTWFVTSLDSPPEGLSALGWTLHGIGIPRASARRYEAAVKMHKLLLIAHGAANELMKAKDLLHQSRPEEIDIHFAEMEISLAA